MKLFQINYLEIPEDKKYEDIIEKVLIKCYEEESFSKENFYINIVLTNPSNIQQINEQYRNIDKPTDVLSFPMFEQEELKKYKKLEGVGQEVLGDIIISIEQVIKQAKEYGHSFEREFAYMLVHGFYHIIGYDHIAENDKKVMREKEENILEKLNIKREEEING